MNFRDPRYLYRYYSFDEKKHYEDILFKDTLYFSSPKNFNDPFDKGLNIKFKGKGKKFITNHLLNEVLPYAYTNFDKEKENRAKDFIEKNYPAFNPNNKSIELLLQQGSINFVLSSGVCCFSELNNNILMWSHYAWKHTGFCVNFNYEELVKSIFKYNKKNNVIIYPHKVIYKKKYPRISGYDKNQVDSLFIKSSLWKYEKEWRFSYSFGDDKKVPLPKSVVSAIYMGLEIEKSNEDIIRKAVSAKQYKIELYKAKKIQNKFALCFEKIK